MRNVLYDVDWQKLRVSCLSVNHPNGGFTTTAGTDDNLKRLNIYVFGDPDGEAYEAAKMGWPDASWAHACRVWRVLNLLNATRMGYSGQGQQGSDMDMAVKTYRDSLQAHTNGSLVTQAGNAWRWDVVQKDLETLWANERYWFTAIYNDLSRRARVATKRREDQDITGTRGDLVHFIEIMKAVNLH